MIYKYYILLFYYVINGPFFCLRNYFFIIMIRFLVSFFVGFIGIYGGKITDYVTSVYSNEKFLPRSFIKEGYNANVNDLECQVRKLAFQYAQQIQSFRDQNDTYTALNIDGYCANIPGYKDDIKFEYNKGTSNIIDGDSIYTVYVDPINGNDNNNGSINSPFLTLYKAVDYLRSFKSNDISKQIIIREGILYMNNNIKFSPNTYDNNLLIRSYPNEKVTISGGVLLKVNELKWNRYDDGNKTHNIWVTKLDDNIVASLYNNRIYSLFTLNPHTRIVRARYPNGHPEVWNNGAYFINPYYVNTWNMPESGNEYKPHQIYKDLSDCKTTNPCLNHSEYKPFDTYTAGYGNLCDLWEPSFSYWCGQNCAGGWGEQDQRMATEGIRQLPTGMNYNITMLPEIGTWNDISDAVFHIKHSQGWNMFMWETGDYINTELGNISFGNGGWQGGRVWTKTSDINKQATTNLPILGGQWYIENVLDILDMPGEWFFNRTTNELYYWPNNTNVGESPVNTSDLVIGNLSNIFTFQSDYWENPINNVTINGIIFRDTRYTYLDRWGTPSVKYICMNALIWMY